MPWEAQDSTRHTKKADTKATKRQWSTIANKILEDSGDEGKAIRIANAAVSEHPSRRPQYRSRG